jgi:peptidyl-prolyl cis-trans isomerase C
MKALSLFLFACATLAWGQFLRVSISPEIADNQVIARFPDGTAVTMGEFRGYVAANPPETQQQIAMDPAVFVKQFAMARELANMAKEKKLDQESPIKDMLYYNTVTFLGQMMLQNAYQNLEVTPEEIVKEYEASKTEKYRQVKVDAIYIAFGDPSTAPVDGKKVLTEEQAKDKAAKLLAQIRAGADFAKLARENSDDETSRDKGGYLDTLNPGDNIPEGFQVVFKMNQGETSEPIKQPNGYYLLRAEVVDFRPLKDVRDKVFNDLKGRHLTEFMNKVNAAAKVDFPNPAFQPKTPAPAPGGASKK